MSTFNNYVEDINSHYSTRATSVIHGIRDPDKDFTSGNHHVINAVHHIFMDVLGGDSKGLVNSLTPARFIYQCEGKLKGTYNRYPGNTDENAHDDYIGIISTCYIYGLTNILNTIYTAGSFIYYYDNTNSSLKLKHWFGRFGWFQAVLKQSIGKPLYWWETAAYVVYMLVGVLNRDRTSVSGHQLRWITKRIMKSSDKKLIQWAIRSWENYICKEYEDGMREVFYIYYGRSKDGIIHPFVEYMDWKV